MKRILFISYDGMTDVLGQSQVLPYLAGLSAFGFKITILSFEKRKRFRQERHIVEGIVTKAGISWIPVFYHSKPPVLSKMYDRWRMRKEGIRLQKTNSFDIVHCRSYVAAETGLYLKRKFGIKFLFDMRGFWADERVDNGQWDLGNPFYKKLFHYYKRQERSFLVQADAIVCLTYAAQKELMKNLEYRDLPFFVIPCCADLEHFNYHQVSPLATDQRKKELDIDPNAKVITYLGSVGGWYMVKEMFELFNSILMQEPNCMLLFITKDDVNRVRQEAGSASVDPDKIRVIYSSRNDLPEYLSVSDVSVFFIRPTYSKIASSPTKHAELMGMGIPVICNDIGDTGIIINETGTGILVKEFSEMEYEAVAANLTELYSMDKTHIRDMAFRYFDLQKGVEKYKDIYLNLSK